MTELEPNRTASDLIALTGMAVVGVAAAVLSFSTWVQLAETVGFTQTTTIDMPFTTDELVLRIAWLLPLAVDCYALTVIRVWLNSPHGSGVVRYAKGNAIGAIVLTVAAQAVYHAVTVADQVKPADLWPFAVVIGGIPPLLLGLVMDLYTRLKHEGRTVEPALNALLDEDAVEAILDEPERREPSAEPAAARDPEPAPAPVARARVKAEPKLTKPSNVTQLDARRGSKSDAELMPTVRRLVREGIERNGRAPGIGKVRAELNIAYERTRDLIQVAVAELNHGSEPAESDDADREDSPMTPNRELVAAGVPA